MPLAWPDGAPSHLAQSDPVLRDKPIEELPREIRVTPEVQSFQSRCALAVPGQDIGTTVDEFFQQPAVANPHPTWSKEEIAQFRAFWPIGSGARQAFEVIYWTGTRCVDAAKIGWDSVNNGILEFTQEKTGGVAVVPVTAPVPQYLEADQRLFLQAANAQRLFIMSKHGKGRTVKALSQLVANAAREAGILGRTAHGLRKARAVFLAEHSWTPNEIGAWTGHESLTEIAHYTRGANKKAMIMGKQVGKSEPQ